MGHMTVKLCFGDLFGKAFGPDGNFGGHGCVMLASTKNSWKEVCRHVVSVTNKAVFIFKHTINPESVWPQPLTSDDFPFHSRWGNPTKVFLETFPDILRILEWSPSFKHGQVRRALRSSQHAPPLFVASVHVNLEVSSLATRITSDRFVRFWNLS